MSKIALIVLSGTDDPSGHGRFIHALTAALELKESGKDFKLAFEGIGVTWLNALHEQEHPVVKAYGSIFNEVKDHVLGACNFCTTKRFQARASADALGVPMLGAEGEHFSFGTLVDEGYQPVTF